MVKSKGWDWEIAYQKPWLLPSEDSYYLARRWKDLGFKRILDLGAGLGRHSILFAKEGFEVAAIDLSEYAMKGLKEWSERENLDIDIRIGDMIALPYEDNSLDAVFACHVISHTDTEGTKKVISEIKRVLKPGGEIYTSMCSKDSYDFAEAGFPKIDENTILYTLDGPDKDVPHFYADVDDILNLFQDFDIEKIKHITYSYVNSTRNDNDKYYYLSGRRKL